MARYVVLLRETRSSSASSPRVGAFQQMSAHAGESDAQLRALQRCEDVDDSCAGNVRIADKTRIISAADPFTRTDQINMSSSKNAARGQSFILAVAGPFSLPFVWDRFVRLWTQAGRGAINKLLEGHRLACEHGVPFYVDLHVDYGSLRPPGDDGEEDDEEDEASMLDEEEEDVDEDTMSI